MSCLMNFGEINIPSSRAFWDDCDDDENPVEVNKLNFKYEDDFAENEPAEINTLLVLEGAPIMDFVKKSFLEDAKKVCSIVNKEFSIYYLEAHKVLFVIMEDDLKYTGEIFNLLLPYVTAARKVITLKINSKVNYTSPNISQIRDKVTFIRKICGKLENIQQLQSPNFISGISAGISSWLYNESGDVNSYVAYTDTLPLDGLAAQPILQLIQQLGVPCPKTYNATVTETSQLYL